MFHSDEDGTPLPRDFMMFNQGHDGHCDCWDTRVVTESGEHPIVYIDLAASPLEPAGTSYDSFRAYVEELALNHARHIPDKTKRRKASRLIRDLGGQADK